jgi:hypothetical protein
MELTKEQIERINKELPYDLFGECQGIFTEPNGIPNDIKEPVVYLRYESGGVSGGSCWDSSNPQSYTKDEIPDFIALDKVLEVLCPNVTYLKYKQIEKFIHDTSEVEREYYGNRTEFTIKYIKLSDIIKILL